MWQIFHRVDCEGAQDLLKLEKNASILDELMPWKDLGRRPINGDMIQDAKSGRFHVFEFLAYGRAVQ